ncbi:hypothetical protein FITA111629_07990 [Filibacter tadaridae]|uniref:Uncharacterized protein n=1 Tax=Filibacter tadaridae TaxID=2483811 RepID=A0A3P5XE30_9BACL|nr:hypothetical protein [Filibacter tadaridae]VDC25804.1 hypothetical protein FILTAD_01303 [Filibacter tadaridae]
MCSQNDAQLPADAADVIVGYMEQGESELLIEVADDKQVEKNGLLMYISAKVEINLPKSDVLKYKLGDGSFVCLYSPFRYVA